MEIISATKYENIINNTEKYKETNLSSVKGKPTLWFQIGFEGTNVHRS
jgi:hypothetical protein